MPTLKETARIDCLNELGTEYGDRYWTKSQYLQTDTALLFTQLAMNESINLHYQRGIAKANLNMSIIEEIRNNIIVSLAYLQKALPSLQKENMQANFHRARVFLGWCFFRTGSIKQSIAIYQNELPYYEDTKDTSKLDLIYRITARAYSTLGNSEQAFAYLQKDFAVKKQSTDNWGKRSTATLQATVYLAAGDTANATIYYEQAAIFSKNQRAVLGVFRYNMTTAYILRKQFDAALSEIKKGTAEIQSSNNDSLYRKVALMNNYNSLADILLSLKQYDSAILYSKEATSFFKSGSDIINLMLSLKTLAAAYNAKGENSTALLYTNQLLGYSKKSGARPFERDAYKLLSQIYTDQHRTGIADAHHLKYIILNDSLQKDKYISQSTAWKAINDLNINEVKHENQLKLNEERNNIRIASITKEKKIQSYAFILAVVLIGLFASLMTRNNRLKRKKDQLQLMIIEANIAIEKQKQQQEITQLHQQKTELELQALRAQMNPHFIFNCLNSINSFILKNEPVKAADYLTKFAKLIRIVLEQSGKSFVPLEDELKCLQLYMDLEALRFEKPFQYTIECNCTDVSAVMIPTLLLQPFVENAIWHGLAGKESGGRIDINIQQRNNFLVCKIADNGIGRKASASKESNDIGKKSLGITLTHHRLQLINFTNENIPTVEYHDIENDEGECIGTFVDINIPIQKI